MLSSRKRKRQYNEMLSEFADKYSIHVPQNCRLMRNNSDGKNHFTLVLPHWMHETKYGNADKRYNYNPIVNASLSVFIDNYIITSQSIITVLAFVHELRENGIYIEPNPLEVEKAQKHLMENSTQALTNSLASIISRFAEHPTQFEYFCADMFRKEGFIADVTSATNDGGYDILITAPQTGEQALVECKCYDYHNSIGRPMLQKLYGANAAVNASHLIFITTSDFTKVAVDYGRQVGIELINGKALLERVKSLPQEENIVRNASNEPAFLELTPDDIISLLPDDLKHAVR